MAPLFTYLLMSPKWQTLAPDGQTKISTFHQLSRVLRANETVPQVSSTSTKNIVCHGQKNLTCSKGDDNAQLFTFSLTLREKGGKSEGENSSIKQSHEKKDMSVFGLDKNKSGEELKETQCSDSQVTNLGFQGFIVLMDFCHGIKRRVVGKQTSVQKPSHWSKICWGSTTGAGSSPYKLFWCYMTKEDFSIEGSPDQIRLTSSFHTSQLHTLSPLVSMQVICIPVPPPAIQLSTTLGLYMPRPTCQPVCLCSRLETPKLTHSLCPIPFILSDDSFITLFHLLRPAFLCLLTFFPPTLCGRGLFRLSCFFNVQEA